ncbi:Ras-related protein Rab-18 [Dirofilaria immitis]|nr:Ras-related protein Rab-18 [Dirofilaria immitis]
MADEGAAITTLKILIIGESGVGKSSLMLRFVDDTFDPEIAATIGVDFRVTSMIVDNNRVKLAIWARHSWARTISYFNAKLLQGAQGVICVYDVSNRQTFERLSHWMNEVDTYSTKTDAVKMLIGNKIDISSREVTREEGLEFAKKYRMLFIEASAKTREGVQCAFEELIEKILQTPGLWDSDRSAFALGTGVDQTAGLFSIAVVSSGTMAERYFCILLEMVLASHFKAHRYSVNNTTTVEVL